MRRTALSGATPSSGLVTSERAWYRASMKQVLRVGVAQIESALGDLDANLDKHLAYVERARAEGVEILLFPEMSMTGHSAGPDTLSLARRRTAPMVQKLAEASVGMTTIFGMIEEAPAAQFHNAQLVVRDGRLQFLHHKVNLATYGKLEEGKHFASGRYVETFEIDDWRAAVLICADLWNPALVHLAAVHGSTLLFAPISSAIEAVGADFDNPGGWGVNVSFYAMTYGLPVVMANRVGTEGDLTFWGGSRIVDPFGRVLAQADRGEQLIAADVDYELVRRARYLLPTVRDSNLDLLHREIERLRGIIGVPRTVRPT